MIKYEMNVPLFCALLICLYFLLLFGLIVFYNWFYCIVYGICEVICGVFCVAVHIAWIETYGWRCIRARNVSNIVSIFIACNLK